MRSCANCSVEVFKLILADTGALYALADRADRNHDAAATYARGLREPLAVHSLILAEAWYLLESRLGTAPARRLCASVASGALVLLQVDPPDIQAALDIENQYADLELGLTDSVSLALCERERLATVFTFDRRDFGAYRPTFTDALTLSP